MSNFFITIRCLLEKAKGYFYLDTLSWILFILSLILNLFLWYLWLFKIPFNRTPMFFSFAVLLINSFLAFLFSRKDVLIPYFLLGTALLVQILTLVLLRYSFLIGY